MVTSGSSASEPASSPIELPRPDPPRFARAGWASLVPWRARDELEPEVPPWDPTELASLPRDRPVLVTAAAAALAAGIVVGALWLFGWVRAPGPASIDEAMPFIDQTAFDRAKNAATKTDTAGDDTAGNDTAGADGAVGEGRSPDDPGATGSNDATGAANGPSTLLGGASGAELSDVGEEAAPVAAIVVHVAGAVRRPGLVTLDEGDRVQAAIDAAGGAKATADIDRLNLATVLVDGQRLYVPAIGEDDSEAPSVVAPSGPDNAGAQSGDGAGSGSQPVLIDVNTASAAELETVPGIGPVTAEKIIAKREAIGGFDTIEDLLEVSGIGDARLASMRDYLRVGTS